MQPISACLTTFSPSHLPCLVARPRLLEGLRSQPARGPLFIQGQAAQGKTTLVADFLKAQQATVVWVCLEDGSDDAMAFHTLFRQALEHAWPASVASRPVKRPITPQRPKTPSPDTVQWQHQLQRICSELPDGLEIVIDGLERLADESSTYRLVGELCRQSANRWRVWLLSRRMSSFSALRRWVGASRWILNNDDLAFTPAETALYFQTLHQMEPDPDWIDRLHRLTDGWCGALTLISQAMQNRPKDFCDAFFDLVLRNLSADAMPFFATDLFGRLSLRQRRLLLQMSLLDIIDPALLCRMPGMADCPGLIQDLFENIGFIRSFRQESGTGVRFRLNRLFHDFLQTRLAIDLSPEQQRTLYHELGQAYDRQGELTVAIPWYLKSSNLQSASEAIKGAGIELIIKGQLSQLEAWLEQLPPDQVKSDPWLFLLLTLARRMKGQAKCVADYHLAWEAFHAGKDIRGAMLTAAFAIEALVFQARAPDEILTWVRRGEALLAVQGAVPYYAWAKLLLWLQIAFGYIAGGLDLAKGMSAGRNALLLAGKMGNDTLIMQANIVYSLGLIDEGRLDQAHGRLSGAAPLPETLSALAYDVLKRLARAELERRGGDPPGAEECLRSVRKDIEAHGLVFLYPRFVEATGFTQLVRKDYDQARSTARHFLDVSVLTGSARLKSLAHRLSALVDYHCEKYSQSATEADRALKIMDHQGVDILPAMRTRQLRAMIALHLGDNARALMLLNRALDYFKATSNAPALAETHLMLALVHHQVKNPQACRVHLKQGYRLADGERVTPFLVLSPKDRQEISILADRDDEQASGPAVSTPPTERAAPHPNGTAATAALAVIDRPQAPPGWLDVRTFGRFLVLRDGKYPITDRQWGGNRPKLLFKALLVHGLREIPRDIIIDNLWPESAPQSALQNFKVTLHRLRKSLEPDLDSHKSSAFVHLKDNLISLDHLRCRVDLEEFLVCCKEIRRNMVEGKVDQIPLLGHHLTALYQGDFMPEEPYAPWMEMKRWALRDTYFDAILTVSAVHRDQGRLEAAADCCRSAIQIDPLQERIIRELIMLCTRLGRHKDARDVFEQYRSALRQELGMEPDKDMLALMKPSPVLF